MDSNQDTEMSADWLNDWDQNGESSRPQKPLKRGDACLACRKRRIRPSRIAKLKDRIGALFSRVETSLQQLIAAELENQVAGSSDRRRTSASTSEDDVTPPLQPFHSTSFDFSLPHADVPTAPMTAAFGQAPAGPSMPIGDGQGTVSLADLYQFMNGHAGPIPSLPPPDVMPTFSGEGSVGMNGLSDFKDYTLPGSSTYPAPSPYAQSSNPRPLQQPDPNFNFDFGLLDPTMVDLSTDLDLSASFTTFDNEAGLAEDSSGPSTDPSPDPTAMSGIAMTHATRRGARRELIANEIAHGLLSDRFAMDTSRMAPMDHLKPDAPASIGHETRTDEEWQDGIEQDINSRVLGIPAIGPGSSGLTGGWFDPDDVPPGVRDHLLDLYFSGGGVLRLLLNLPRFYARLTLPPTKRPHPALMYTMYVCGARGSSQTALRSLEGRFYEIAQAKIHQGLREADRLLDILRALILMTGYLFAREWYSLAYNTAGSTIRLAIACGLHRIPSNVFTAPRRYHLAAHFTLRTAGHALEPPEDATELGERINTFWSVYEIDRCTFIAYQWDALFHLKDIMTPLPRPLEEYTLGLVTKADDIRIGSVLNEPARAPYLGRFTDFVSLRLRALTLLAATVQLRQCEPEDRLDGTYQYDDSSPPSPGRFGSGRTAAHESNPIAFARTKAAIDRFCRELPETHALPWSNMDEGEDTMLPSKGRISKETAVLWFVVGNIYIHLWNQRVLASPNVTAVMIAKRMVSIMAAHASDAVMGGYAAFILCIWFEVKRILVRELKRLEVLKLSDAVVVISRQMDTFDEAFKEWMTSQSAEALDSIERAAVEDKVYHQLRAMTPEQWLAAMNDTDTEPEATTRDQWLQTVAIVDDAGTTYGRFD